MNASEIKDSLLQRFKNLIDEGCKNRCKTGAESFDGWGSDYPTKIDPSYCAWMAQVESLLHEVLPPKSPVRDEIKQVQKMSQRNVAFEKAMGLLEGVKNDIDSELFGLLLRSISESVAIDYFEQAKALLSDKANKSCSHVPAAVLAGAILENRLRMLCQSANPPIETKKDNGRPKKMTEMIDCLRHADIINEVLAKHLRAWSDIRNAAAHYRPNEITKKQVCAMIKGVGDFIQNSPQL